MSADNRRIRLGRYLRLCYSLSDLLLFNLIFGLALWLFPDVAADDLRLMWAMVSVSYMAILVRNRGLRLKDRTILLDRVVADSLINVGVHALFFLSLCELLARTPIPLSFYLIYYAMMVVALPVWNIVSRRLVKAYRRRGINFTRVAIV